LRMLRAPAEGAVAKVLGALSTAERLQWDMHVLRRSLPTAPTPTSPSSAQGTPGASGMTRGA
jgi:hypothetical protein